MGRGRAKGIGVSAGRESKGGARGGWPCAWGGAGGGGEVRDQEQGETRCWVVVGGGGGDS